MIEAVIRWSIRQRIVVLLAALLLILYGAYAVKETPVDAIPDLSDVQVIIKTSFPGQAPQLVQDQVTYPITTAMLAVPKAVTVRGYSFFGDSYVYVIFEDGTDLYWARARVLEYLAQISALPETAKPVLGPDATGVGWVYSYALVDKTGQHDLADLRSLQDWFLRFELQSLPGVAEVAAVGGMVRQYQVTIDPNKLRAYNIPLAHISRAIRRANQEVGASVIEMAEAEYMVRASGYLKSLADIKKIPLGLNATGTPLQLGDIAEVLIGPQMRRGIAELNGEGEVVGGIVVMRYGENAQRTIAKVKNKLADLQKSLPKGVEIVPTYDRSLLIESSVKNLYSKLIQEFIVVALVCVLFLWHFRSALVIVITLPLGILMAFIVMHWQGINANIMSLGGIAIAIGAMVDAAIVLLENFHKQAKNSEPDKDRWTIVSQAAVEVGPSLFYSLLIISVSFLPVFALQAQEGKLFAPLAYTKTYAMAAAALLGITLVPVLIGYLVRGKINVSRKIKLLATIAEYSQRFYQRTLQCSLKHSKWVLLLAVLLLLSSLWPLTRLGSEFMPPLDEGDLMYMPSTYAGISIGKARQLLQQTDKLIRQLPEVETVFGKIGRAETATDPAPLTMIETMIQLKPKAQWRPGMTLQGLQDELNRMINFPGLTNTWVMPIKNRLDMLATGIRTPVGIKVAGADLATIESIGRQLERIVSTVPGTASVYSERVVGGRYIKVDINRDKAARFGLNIADVQAVVRTAIGGMNVTETTEGLERYPINLRYPQAYRDSLAQLQMLPVITPNNERIALADIAKVYIDTGPPVIKSENARLNGWTYIDINTSDLGSYVLAAQQAVNEQLSLPPGYSINWAGQYEYMLRAEAQLKTLIPLVLLIIILLLYLNFRRLHEVLVIMLALPFSLVGGLWLVYLLGYQLSVAVAVGFIALAGVSVELSVLMLMYIKQSYQGYLDKTQAATVSSTRDQIQQAIIEGAVSRLRPILMTSTTIIIGLIPVMLGTAAGTDVMQRIAAPMLGGALSALLLTLLLMPVLYHLFLIKYDKK